MKKTALIALGLSLALAGCANIKTTASLPQPANQADPMKAAHISVDAKTGQEYLNNQLVVSLGKETEAALVQRLQATVVDRIPQLNVVVLEISGSNSAAIAERLQAEGNIRYAQPHLIYQNAQPESRQNVDPRLGDLNTRKDIFDELPQYALDANHLHAMPAWLQSVRGKGVLVSVIDDPVDVTHPDLRANWAGKAYDARTGRTYTTAQSWIDAIDGMGRMPQPIDNAVDESISHGTAVASTIIAARDGKGVVGIAPEAKYMSAAIFTPNSVGSANIAKAILWSVDNGAQILNNSWGGAGYDQLTKEAFDYALERDVTVVVSSGNSSRQEHSRPAFYPGAIAVGALAINNTKATFSTFGRHISVSAPGVDVIMASPMFFNQDGSRKTGATPKDGSGYTLMSGTSFSGPYVAGAAALVLGERPKLDPFQVRRILEMTADGRIGSNANGYDIETGYGAVRADRIAALLKNTNGMRVPPKGGNLVVKVEVKMPDGSYAPANRISDIIINLPEGGDSSKGPIYGAQTNAQGEARFLQIAPGTYTVRVGTPDTIANPDAERGTMITQAVVTSSTPNKPTVLTVRLDKGYVAPPPNLNTDPYEPNDSMAQATPLTLGTRTKGAMIYNNVCTFNEPDLCDVDFYKFEAEAGKTYTLTLFDRFHPTEKQGNLIGIAYIRDSAGTVLRDAKGLPITPNLLDNQATFTPTSSGTHYIQVGSSGHLRGTTGERPYTGFPSNSPENTYAIELK